MDSKEEVKVEVVAVLVVKVEVVAVLVVRVEVVAVLIVVAAIEAPEAVKTATNGTYKP